MAETFGKTDKGTDEHDLPTSSIIATQYESGSAGFLASMSVYILEKSAGTPDVKCAIYDAGQNLLTNGITEEKQIPTDYDDWMTFDFPVSPEVVASTDYLLAFWNSGQLSFYWSTVGGWVRKARARAYNGWPNPLGGTQYLGRQYSIYATYAEAPPKKTLVQAALISIPPLVVLPTVGQILKVTGGC